jgi:nucleoside-diphosphate-sugar epimerase
LQQPTLSAAPDSGGFGKGVLEVIVCVVGGAGFIGRRLVRLLATQGHEVICADIAATTSFEDLGERVRVVRMDLSSFEGVVSTFDAHRPHVVVNLSYMLGDYAPRPAFRLNVLGMDNCFEAARLCGVKHVVFASSIAVNGGQQHYGDRPVRETDPTMAAKQYAVHKVFNEWQAKEYREKHGMCITAVRAANISGVDKVLGSLDHVRCIVGPARGEAVTFPHRDRMRCVVYADDIADVFARIALKDRPEHTIYNSGGQTLSLGQIAEMVRRLIPRADIRFDAETGGVHERGAAAYRFDNERLVREFGICYPPYEERVAQMIDLVRSGAKAWA